MPTPANRPGPNAGEPGRPAAGGDARPSAGAEAETGVPSGGHDGWETSNQLPEPATPGAGEQPAAGQRGDGQSGAGRPTPTELDIALGEIDGQILSERATIQARRNETAGRRPTPDVPRDDAAGGQGAPGGGGEVEAPGGQETRPPRPTPVRMPGLPVPPDVADARDDDVVCRQLREAAMQETDVALREKLWDEYRRCRER